MADPTVAPVLSTPAANILEPQPLATVSTSDNRLSDEQLYIVYEIDKTVAEIRRCKYQRVALQFPDNMLVDAPRVYRTLRHTLMSQSLVEQEKDAGKSERDRNADATNVSQEPKEAHPVNLFILGDTSYGPCCIDEIAAEHADADVVIHYGRACLSPTARIPAVHIFTNRALPNEEKLVENFRKIYDFAQKIIIMADVIYQSHVHHLVTRLRGLGYTDIFETGVLHNPASAIPNRTIPAEVELDPAKLQEWRVFHLSHPPQALLLILSSRVASLHIYPVADDSNLQVDVIEASSRRALGRRYALLTSVSTVSIFGILINTLSVKDYQQMADHVKAQIEAAGKKSYTFVVGKLNAAKVANFSEVAAWVVIGCWESSLVDSTDFWRPLITPFELTLALQRDDQRVWTGEWSSDFDSALHRSSHSPKQTSPSLDHPNALQASLSHDSESDQDVLDGELESEPPEFDLRKGTYVSLSRPMATNASKSDRLDATVAYANNSRSNALTIRAKGGGLATTGGAPSPGADFLQTKRTWKGLGSDFQIAYEDVGGAIQEGRSGIARGYRNERSPG